DRDIGLVLLRNKLGQAHRAQETEDMGIEIRPQLMRHAALAVVLATLPPCALRGIDRLVDRYDDLRHRDRLRASRQAITAARAAHALDQAVPAQLAEQLLEIGQRNLLPLR